MKKKRVRKKMVKLTFVETSMLCPEQYDVFDENKKRVGYVRLRWGWLTCYFPDVDGKEIYKHQFKNDLFKGMFDNQKERDKYLKIIKKKILEKIEKT